MTTYAATLTAAAPTSKARIPDEALEAFADTMAAHAGAVSAAQDHRRYSATFDVSVDEDDPAVALTTALRIFRNSARISGLQPWPIVRAEILTVDEQARELDTPTVLVGIAELADLLEVSRQRVTQLATRPDFPAPIARLRSGPVWAAAPIDAWRKTWNRSPGRPRLAVPQ